MTRTEWFKDYFTYTVSMVGIHAGMRAITAKELAQSLAMAYNGLGLNHLDEQAKRGR